MSDGPTTAGSIIGRLRLDKAQWDADVAGAKGDARELGATEATVKVDANVGAALAKLEAVRAAQEKLGFATDNLKIAYQRLDEVQTKGGASESRLMSLHLSAAKAESAHEAATRGLATAQAALAASEDDAASAGKRLVDSNDKIDASNKKTAASSGVSITRLGLIAGAIAAIIPMASELTGYAVGVGGALAGMGAAGVLAVLGIKNAMADGTAVGNQFAAGLQVADGYLHQLEQTATAGVLNGFISSLSVVGAAMPQLNSQIAMFSKQLGVTATFITQGLVSAFHVLNPLFVQAGQYIEQVAQGLASWTSNGGLQQFATAAMGALPQVAATLQALVKGALDLIGAFAPFGGVMLNVLTLVGGLVSAISPLLAALTPLAVAAGAVYGAFRLWSNIGPTVISAYESIALMGMYTVEAVGAVGLLAVGVAAVVVAIVGWNAVMAAQAAFAQQAALGTQDYTAAIIADSGAIKENTAAIVAKNLHDSGALEQAHKLGISTLTLTEAIFGNKTAIDQVNAATKDNTNGSAAQDAQLKKTGLSLTDLGLAHQWVRDAVKNNTLSVKEGKDAYKALQDAQQAANLSTQSALTLTGQLAAAQQAAKSATDAFALALAGLGNVNLSATQANVAYMQSVADATAAVSKNGATLDINTQAGRDNTTALDNIASSAVAVISAQAKTGTSADTLTTNMQGARDSFIQTAEKMGATAAQAGALADQYGLIPANVSTAYTTSGDAAAKKTADELQYKLDHLPRLIPITVQMTGVTTGAPILAGTNGGRAFFADGGTTHAAGGLTVPGQSRPYGDSVSMMLAPSEEVISNRNGQADNNRGLLKLVNSGATHAQIAGYANRQAGTSAGGSGGDITVTVVNKTGVTLSDLIDIQVQRNNQRQKMGLTAGRQKGSF